MLWPSVRSSTTSDLRNPVPLRLLLFSTESAHVHLPQTDTQTPQTHHLLLLDNFYLCFKSQAFSFFRGVCAVSLNCPPPLVRPSLLFLCVPHGPGVELTPQLTSTHHVGAQEDAQVIRHGSRHPCPQSHLGFAEILARTHNFVKVSMFSVSVLPKAMISSTCVPHGCCHPRNCSDRHR